MGIRPELTNDLKADIFLNYYYLKEELENFCRRNGLQVKGGKIALTNRIYKYLATGEKQLSIEPVKKISYDIGEITEDSLLEDNFICSEKHRYFFEQKIGKSFKFNVHFQKWLKANSGKTYKYAIDAYYQILSENKTKKNIIDKQFEYNTYIRDFFESNKDKSLNEAIKCWNYKKGLPGHNKYEKSDLIALE